MIRNYRLHLILALLVATIGTFGFQFSASAARMTISRQACDLGVFPFDDTKAPTFGAALNPWIKHVSSVICKNHLTVPTNTPYTAQSYNPQPVADSADIPLQAGAQNYHGPTAVHKHDYYNDSLEDSYYYESYVAKFAIDFAGDTKLNTLDDIYCDTPYPNPAPAGTPSKAAVIAELGDCDGDIDGLWGGTHVEKLPGGNGVMWTFGMDDPAEKPRIFGKNPSLDPLIGIDTDNEDFRNFGANVNLTTFDVNSPTGLWSSSTSSRILVRDFAILKTNDMSKLTNFCSSAGDYSKWCSLPTPAGYQSGTPEGGSTANYYWFPLATTSAVWRTPPPQDCTSLTITNADAQDGVLDAVSGSPFNYNFNVQSTTTGGLNLDYKWTAVPPLGSTFDGAASGYIDTGTSTAYAYNNPVDGTVITVTAVKEGQPATVYNGCKDTVTIDVPPPSVECESLDPILVMPLGGLTPDSPMTLTTSPNFDPAMSSINLKIKWTAAPVAGNFKDQTVADPNQPASGFTDSVNDFTVFYTGGPTGTVITAQALDAVTNLPIPACKRELTIPPSSEACIGLDLLPNGPLLETDLPELFTATANVSGGLLIDYKWEMSENNTLSINSVPYGAPVYTVANNVNVTQNNPLTVPITLSVTAVNKAMHSTEYTPQCKDSVTINPQGQQNFCEDLNLIPPNASLSYNDSILLFANPENQNPPHPANVTWSETGPGWFTSWAGNPAYCPVPVDNVQFTAPKIDCLYTYHSGPNGSGTFFVEATPNDGNVAACKYQFTVPIKPPPQNPVCVSLDFNPDLINPNASTSYTGAATFSNGATYPVNIEWTGVNGTFTNGSSSHLQTNVSSASLGNTFNSTDDSGEVTAHVESFLYNGNTITVPNNQCEWNVELIPPPSPPCEDLELLPPNSANEICIDIEPDDYDGTFTWTIGDDAPFETDDLCIPFTTEEIDVYATDDQAQCNDHRPPVPVQPPRFVKGVRRGGIGDFVRVLSISSTQKDLEYRLTFTPASGYPVSALITDDISDGEIDGETNPDSGNAGDIVYKQGSMDINLAHCDDNINITENCYKGDIGKGGVELVKVTGSVRIVYAATVVNSAITPDNCIDGKICQEVYENLANAHFSVHYTDVDQTPYEDIASNAPAPNVSGIPVRVQIFCQYILTRAAGDIFLETDLNAGVDIRMCSRYKSTTGVIITPGEAPLPTAPKTGTGTEGTIFAINHEICTEGQAGTLPTELADFYGQGVSQNLSSQICEVKLRSGEAWKQTAITNGIEENKTRISRWEPDYEFNDVNITDILNSGDYENKQVFHIKGHDLIINRPYTLNDGEGAKTFIIEDGDLIISEEIKYGTCNQTLCNARDIASLAFIVLNGSVYVDPGMLSSSPNEQSIAGVYFVQEGDRAQSGQLFSGTGPLNNDAPAEKKLTVYGSIYGDIEPLFLNRQFSGSPDEEDAGIVIRFDERVILNTPPGLRDVLNLTQTEVAR